MASKQPAHGGSAQTKEFDWQLDARMKNGSLDVVRVFCDGDSIFEEAIPDWVEQVAREVGEHLEGGR